MQYYKIIVRDAPQYSTAKIVSVLKDMSGMNTMEAKSFLDTLPGVLFEKVDEDKSKIVKEVLRYHGLTIEVMPSASESYEQTFTRGCLEELIDEVPLENRSEQAAPSVTSSSGNFGWMSEDFFPQANDKSLALEALPGAVSDCVRKLGEMDGQIIAATQRAKTAVDAAHHASTIKLAWYKIGDKAAAIESLQAALVDMSQSGIAMADAIKMVGEFQRQLANAMRFLVSLGIGNMSAARVVYRALKAELQGASTKDLSELAREELRRTVEQIKNQLDVMEQQERLKDGVKSNKTAIDDIKKLDDEQDAELERQRDKDNEHDKRLDEHERVIKKLQAELEKQRRLNEVCGCNTSAASGWYRSSDQKIVAGVCGGLAHRLSMNLIALRIIAAVLSLISYGLIPLIYLLLIFVLKPRSTTPAYSTGSSYSLSEEPSNGTMYWCKKEGV